MLLMIINLWSISSKLKNKNQRSYNGNIRKYHKFSDIVFQNLPGTKSPANLQICLDVLLAPKPAILAIGEASFDKLSLCHTPGYTLLQGTQTNSIKMRLNLLIKEGVGYEVLDMENELPTAIIKMESGFYLPRME